MEHFVTSKNSDWTFPSITQGSLSNKSFWNQSQAFHKCKYCITFVRATNDQLYYMFLTDLYKRAAQHNLLSKADTILFVINVIAVIMCAIISSNYRLVRTSVGYLPKVPEYLLYKIIWRLVCNLDPFYCLLYITELGGSTPKHKEICALWWNEYMSCICKTLPWLAKIG